VARDVRHGFLKHAECGDRLHLIQPARLRQRRHAAAQAGPAGNRRRFKFDRRRQVEIERRRTQVLGDAPHHARRHLDDADDRLQPVDQVARHVGLDELGGGMDQLVLERSELLSELVVQLAGDGGALFLAGEGDASREAAELCLIGRKRHDRRHGIARAQ